MLIRMDICVAQKGKKFAFFSFSICTNRLVRVRVAVAQKGKRGKGESTSMLIRTDIAQKGGILGLN